MYLLVIGSHDHRVSSFDLVTKNITIDSEVWICARSVVLQGVTCRRGSVLSSGSVAFKDLEKNSIYVGNPALKLKERENIN